MDSAATLISLLLFLSLQSQKLLSLSCDFNTSSHRRHHRQVAPTGQLLITVDASGSGDFLSVQDAVDSIPENNTRRFIVRINAGYYIEKVVVPATKPYVTFQGSGQGDTVIEWHDRASDRGPDGQQLRTYNTASVTVFANYFIAKNISFKNSAPAPLPGMEGWQAAAFRVSGDKAYFFGCGFYGAQDTLCDDAGRHYFKDCYIEGSIDFIFGNGRSMYKAGQEAPDSFAPYDSDCCGSKANSHHGAGNGMVSTGNPKNWVNCWLHSIANRFGSIAAQDRHSPCERTGFAFVGCRVTGSGKLYVGRAMGQYSRIVFAYTYFEDVVAEGGWDDWDHNDAKKKTVFFGVYKCWGPGAEFVRSASWARELDYKAARPFLAKSFVNGRHWLGPTDA